MHEIARGTLVSQGLHRKRGHEFGVDEMILTGEGNPEAFQMALADVADGVLQTLTERFESANAVADSASAMRGVVSTGSGPGNADEANLDPESLNVLQAAEELARENFGVSMREAENTRQDFRRKMGAFDQS